MALLIEGLSQDLCADQDVDLYPDPSFHLLNEPAKYCALCSRTCSIPAFNDSKPICLYLEKSTKHLLTGHDAFFSLFVSLGDHGVRSQKIPRWKE